MGSKKMSFKPACSATETRLKIGISVVASLDIILLNKGMTKGLTSLLICCSQTLKTGFLASRPCIKIYKSLMVYPFSIVNGTHIKVGYIMKKS